MRGLDERRKNLGSRGNKLRLGDGPCNRGAEPGFTRGSVGWRLVLAWFGDAAWTEVGARPGMLPEKGLGSQGEVSGLRWGRGLGEARRASRVSSPGSGSVLVPLLMVSDASAVEKAAVDAARGVETVPALQLRRPVPEGVGSDPRLQALEQKIRPRRGRKGRPRRARPQRLQQKQRSEACQCWPS